jgi:ribosomal protein S27AE
MLFKFKDDNKNIRLDKPFCIDCGVNLIESYNTHKSWITVYQECPNCHKQWILEFNKDRVLVSTKLIENK